jgi:hypothetical protein
MVTVLDCTRPVTARGKNRQFPTAFKLKAIKRAKEGGVVAKVLLAQLTLGGLGTTVRRLPIGS